MFKVLVTENIHEAGLEIFASAADVRLEQKIGLSRLELLEAVGDVDALVTRSGTPLDREILEHAGRLRVVGRAGVGVDNIDLAEASRRGVVVINAPTGNTLAAAEQTMALMLGLVRRLPQAHASLMSGQWRRKDFMGRQLQGKKLLIIGLGRIGSQVAIRARAFGMEVSAYDPYIASTRAEKLGVTLLDDLAGALSLADVVTIHVPLTEETRGMIDARELKAMKAGSYFINCARGGLVDEAHLAALIREGRLAGAAFDAFSVDPPPADHPLRADDLKDKVVLTPHLGANTQEAQSAVAHIAAVNVLAALRGQPYEHAVNLPFMESVLTGRKKQYLSLARKLGILAARLLTGAPRQVAVTLRGTLFSNDDERIRFELPYRYSPYTVSFLKGFFEVHQGPEVNYMSAPLIAEDRGITVDETRGEATTYYNLIEIHVGDDGEGVSLSATVTEEGKQRVVGLNGYWIDVVPEGRLFLFSNHDRPGVIGKVGTMLGEARVNIANFALGRKNGSGLALGALQIDHDVPVDVLGRFRQDPDVLWAETVKFAEGI